MTGKMGLLKTTSLAHFLQILNQIIQHKIAIWQGRLADAMDQKQCRPPAL
jgi:hypothetical protein